MNTITTTQAIELNAKLAVIINRSNPLGLTESGLPQGGVELTASVTGTLRRLQSMAEKAKAEGRATQQALDMLAKVEEAFAGYGVA